MKKDQFLKVIAEEYQSVMDLKEFEQIKVIRDNFVHNKSFSYHGMNVRKNETPNGLEYSSYNSKGMSTKEINKAIRSIIKRYENYA